MDTPSDGSYNVQKEAIMPTTAFQNAVPSRVIAAFEAGATSGARPSLTEAVIKGQTAVFLVAGSEAHPQ